MASEPAKNDAGEETWPVCCALPSPPRVEHIRTTHAATKTRKIADSRADVNQRLLPCLRHRFPSAIFKAPDLLHRHHPAAHHSVEHREELLNLLLAVHDFDDERQIHREPENLCGVQTAGLAEAH